MSIELAIAFVLFTVAGLFTPGPNNTMLFASGLNFGFRRTVPHILGVSFGFCFLLVVVGLGLSALFQAYPLAYTVLKFVGAAYLVWLAIGIARAGPVAAGGEARGRPLTFLGAALFQWVNAKGWVVALSAVTAYGAVAPFPANLAMLAAITLVFSLLSASMWVAFGRGLRRFLSSPRILRIVNVAMALLLIASLYPVLRS